MGRGRQKAKQTKVARALKYHSAAIDVTALERELSGDRDEQGYDERHRGSDDDGDADPYAPDDDANDYASPSRSHR